MKALVLDGKNLSLRTDYAKPTPPAGSALVRVIQAGICETDLQLVAGYMGFQGILGHEFVGIAESGQFAGQRVVGEINCTCQQCELCSRGLGNHCPHRSVIGILDHDGAFADYVVVPEANLHAVPDSIPNDLATLVEPVAAALQIPEQISLSSDMRCCVVGDGRLGNLCAQVIKQAGCELTVVGKHPEKLASFTEFGASTSLLQDVDPLTNPSLAKLNPSLAKLNPSLAKLNPSLAKFDVTVDCTGSESGLATALKLTRPRGTVVMKTTVAGQHALSLAPVVIDELSLIGSRCGPFDKALDALEQNAFQLDNFVSGRYPLAEFERAFAHATTKDALKVFLEVASP